MTGRLRPYASLDELQQRAIDDLYEHDERLALLETGFGKTVVEMTVGEELRAAGVVRRIIVFAPLRVAQSTWPSERFEWEHLKDTPMVEWGGEPSTWAESPWKQSRILWGRREYVEQRLPGVVDVKQKRVMEEKLAALVSEERRVNKAIRALTPPEGWYVTSFENVMWLTSLYAPGESPFDMWVVDETGRVARNTKSPRYKALKKHMPLAKIRHGLNATPAPEGAEDLFGQVQLIAGKRLWGASFHQWRQKFFAPADYMGYTWRLQIGAFDLLMRDLNTVAFRAPATSYGKTYTPREIAVGLPPKARAAYAAMEKQMMVELAEGLDPVVAMSEATASSKLRQITQGFLYEIDAKGRRIVHHMHDEKTEALAELIDSMGREPLLVGFQFDEDLENIRKVFKNVPYIGQGVSARQANENIERWNKRELPVMALHAACLHPDTLVLTEHLGWRKLIDVEASERVFDGVEFVSHRGCQLSGVRPVIELFGVTLTPDHLVLVRDKWVEAIDVRDTGRTSAEARYTYQGDDPRISALLELRNSRGAHQTEGDVEKSERDTDLRSLRLSPHDSYAPLSNLAQHGGPHHRAEHKGLQALRRAWDIARSSVAELQEFLARHAGRVRGRSDDRTNRREWLVLQEQLSMGHQYGAAGKQAEQSYGRVQRPDDALLRVLPGGGRNEGWHTLLPQPVWYGGRSDGGLLKVDVPPLASKPERLQVQKVYDLIDCGPRHRFVVRNDAGEMFVVHNSASHGLNLQYGGHHICHLALPWGLDGYLQLNERIDRRGQTHPVFGHHIVARNSKDQDVSQALMDKDAEQNRVIEAIRRIG